MRKIKRLKIRDYIQFTKKFDGLDGIDKIGFLNTMMRMCHKRMKKQMEKANIILTCHDADCPNCGFPETVIYRNAKTMKPVLEACSNGCGWIRKNK